MKKFLIFFLSVFLAVPVSAAQPEKPRQQFRLGWGDMMFEAFAFHASTPGTFPTPEALPANYVMPEKFDYSYTGHIFAEYLYRFTQVVSVGFQADIEGIFWKEGSFDRYHNLTEPSRKVNNWDLVLMPTVRFTYFEKPIVRLYSGLGTGVLFALDNQGDSKVAPAFNLNWIGVEVGKGHWGGTAELGMLNALTGAYTIYLSGARTISFSVYYKW